MWIMRWVQMKCGVTLHSCHTDWGFAVFCELCGPAFITSHPHDSFSAEETHGSCLFCPYLGMADELWQLMSEQPVKESACNEESAAWGTDAIIFQIKLFPCSAEAILVLAGLLCRRLSRGGLFWDPILFVGRWGWWGLCGGKMWLYIYSFIDNANSGLHSHFVCQLWVDETGRSEIQSQTVLV